ncbi:hypothetical protein FRC19_010464, partial [Serendipita sp. 401]
VDSHSDHRCLHLLVTTIAIILHGRRHRRGRSCLIGLESVVPSTSQVGGSRQLQIKPMRLFMIDILPAPVFLFFFFLSGHRASSSSCSLLFVSL